MKSSACYPAVFAVDHSKAPRIIVTAVKSIIVVAKGSNAVLRVTVSQASPDIPNNAANRTWFGPLTAVKANDKFLISSDRYNLIITNVAEKDAGIYTFVAANVVLTKSVTIRLMLKGLRLTVNAMQSTVTALKGYNAILNVIVSKVSPHVPNDPVNRTWVGPAGLITESSKFFFSSDRYTLIITEIDQSDVGNYNFTATNVFESKTATISLLIAARPTLTALKSIVVVTQGSNVVLQVTVVNASPDVPNNALNRTWYGPSGIITPTSKYSFSSDRYNLTITTVDSTDVGMYTFTAANAVGSDTLGFDYGNLCLIWTAKETDTSNSVIGVLAGTLGVSFSLFLLLFFCMRKRRMNVRQRRSEVEMPSPPKSLSATDTTSLRLKQLSETQEKSTLASSRIKESLRSEDILQPEPVYAAIQEANEILESEKETLTANAAYSQTKPAQEQQTEVNKTGVTYEEFAF
ncbi:hemicentin-2-like [Corticium candelabrum]|uniref:hemicentin-2-like n=1 Tax=Corticium candelabrum TaxID=121492 RepID=UPI002E263381|nr:hemicentin-2-like [Corticium candelabrum]